MERRLIRKRWQITIPRTIRQRLSLYEGQTLNWQIVEWEGGTDIRLFAGSLPLRGEDAGFREELAKISRRERRKRRSKIGISDMFMTPRGREKLREVVFDVLMEFLERQKAFKTDLLPDEWKPGQGGGP